MFTSLTGHLLRKRSSKSVEFDDLQAIKSPESTKKSKKVSINDDINIFEYEWHKNDELYENSKLKLHKDKVPMKAKEFPKEKIVSSLSSIGPRVTSATSSKGQEMNRSDVAVEERMKENDFVEEFFSKIRHNHLDTVKLHLGARYDTHARYERT